jgi:SpoVK/Ycf46/Vps4 family AAA+-type ATPase
MASNDVDQYNSCVNFYPKDMKDVKIKTPRGKLVNVNYPLMGEHHKRIEQFIREQVADYVYSKDKWMDVIPKTVLHILGPRGCGGKTSMIYYCNRYKINLLIVSESIELWHRELVPMVFSRAKGLSHCIIYFDGCENMLLERNERHERNSFWYSFWVQYQLLQFRFHNVWIVTKSLTCLMSLPEDYHNCVRLKGEISYFNIPIYDMPAFFITCLKKYTILLYDQKHSLETQPGWRALESNLKTVLEGATYADVDEFAERILRDYMSLYKNMNVTCEFIMSYVDEVSAKEAEQSTGYRMVRTIANVNNFQIIDDVSSQYYERLNTLKHRYFDIDKLKTPVPTMEPEDTCIIYNPPHPHPKLPPFPKPQTSSTASKVKRPRVIPSSQHTNGTIKRQPNGKIIRP